MFKNTSIFVRIIAIIVLSNALFILFVFIFTIPNIKTGIFDERKQSLKNPVEMVYSLLDSLNNKVVLGQLTLEEAKIKAIETVPKLNTMMVKTMFGFIIHKIFLLSTLIKN